MAKAIVEHGMEIRIHIHMEACKTHAVVLLSGLVKKTFDKPANPRSLLSPNLRRLLLIQVSSYASHARDFVNNYR